MRINKKNKRNEFWSSNSKVISYTTMPPLKKKRKQDDLVEESDAIASDEREIHLQKMESLIDTLRNEAGDFAKFEASMKSLWKEAMVLCETNASIKSLGTIVGDLLDDDDSSDDETDIEDIVNEKDKAWEIKYRELREYRIIRGNCTVSPKEHKELGNWVTQQRKYHTQKGYNLKQERVDKLERLGFSWGSKHPSPPTWDEMFQQLLAYWKRFHNCNLPLSSSNPTPLAKWAAYQRKEYKLLKKGQTSLLMDEQIAKLNGIQFNWNGPKL